MAPVNRALCPFERPLISLVRQNWEYNRYWGNGYGDDKLSHDSDDLAPTSFGIEEQNWSITAYLEQNMGLSFSAINGCIATQSSKLEAFLPTWILPNVFLGIEEQWKTPMKFKYA